MISSKENPEHFHRPTRRQEWQMQPFKFPEQAQALLSAHGMTYSQFVCAGV